MTKEQRDKALEMQLKNSPMYRDGSLIRLKPINQSLTICATHPMTSGVARWITVVSGRLRAGA
jgi:hypothetical protein